MRAVTGLLLDFSDGHRSEFAGSINRVLNALAHVDDMGYCQVRSTASSSKSSEPYRETPALLLLLLPSYLYGAAEDAGQFYLYGCCGMS